MRYEQLTRYSDSEFKRLVGVPRPLFAEMVEVLAHAETLKRKSGRQHDLTLAKTTLKLLASYRYVMTDLGYYSLPECGFKLLIPIKKLKGIPKCKEIKSFNKTLSRYRIKIEHINCQLKHFKILSSKYRNRRKRFGLRMNLIAGLVNWMNQK